MTTYIALLRGINVGGNSLIKMERLRDLWSKLGFENVRTYVQSGNVVFDAEGQPSKWLGKIEAKLLAEMKRPISVIIRTAADLEKLIARNPFQKDKSVNPARLLVMFLSGSAPKDSAKKIGAIDAGKDRFHFAGAEIFLHCINGISESKYFKTDFQKLLGVAVTGRNWNTVTKLYELASA